MAGFECTDKLNAFGERVDFIHQTAHLLHIETDYRNLSLFNMQSVREGIRWSQIEKQPYVYDWSTVGEMIKVGKKLQIQQIWDLCHFGFPDDLTPLHPMFARRFAALCRAFVKFYRSVDTEGALIVTPINEVSFLSWLGGEVRGTSPYCVGQGWEVKYRLMKAYVEGVAALKEADPKVRILTTEPLINITYDHNASEDEILEARLRNEEQFQVTEILCGRMCPELNGKPEYLDILGYNYYYDNQWIASSHKYLDWQLQGIDSRIMPLNQLLQMVHKRYNCPVVLTETSHPKEDRPQWIEMIGTQCSIALEAGIPLWGVCWYPVLDRPDWDHLSDWHHSGIWDITIENSTLERRIYQPVADSLWKVQNKMQPLIHKQNDTFIEGIKRKLVQLINE